MMFKTCTGKYFIKLIPFLQQYSDFLSRSFYNLFLNYLQKN